MARYITLDESLRTAHVNQELRFGWASLHMSGEDYNWTVGFCDMNDQFVYVPHGTRLVGPDNVEYTLELVQDKEKHFGRITGAYLAFLKRKGKKIWS